MTKPMQTCAHPRASVGLDAAYCPDCRQQFSAWSKEYKQMLNQGVRAEVKSKDVSHPTENLSTRTDTTKILPVQVISNSVFVASSQELEVSREALPQQDLNTHSESLNLSRPIPPEGQSSPDITPVHIVTTMCETSPQFQDNSTLLSVAHPVRETARPTPKDADLTISAVDSGGNSSELSETASPDGLFGRTLLLPDVPSQGNSIALWPELSGVLPVSGTWGNGKWFPQPPLERHTGANGYSLLPTPMAHSRAKDNYRTPGQDKLEQKLRALGAIPPGHVSTPEFREWMMALPPGWTDTTVQDGGPTMNLPQQSAPPGVPSPIEQAECKPLAIVALPPKLPSCGEESLTLQNSLVTPEAAQIGIDGATHLPKLDTQLALINKTVVNRSTLKMSTLVCDRVRSSSQTVVEKVPEALGYEPTNLPQEAKKERLQQIGNNTRFLIRTNTINAYLIGKNLYEARALFCDEKGREVKLCCDEGTEIGFVEWLRENAGMGLTNGYNYIKLARNYAFYFEPYLSQPEKWEELEKIIPNTNITALFMLSAPSVPEPARKESVAMLNAGEILTPEEARELIDKYNADGDFTSEDKPDCENKSENFQTISIPQSWSESYSFEVDLNENLKVDVKFNSQYVDGVTKCHLFEFSGDVADSGIRTHYACYKEAHIYPSPQDYAQEVCKKLYI